VLDPNRRKLTTHQKSVLIQVLLTFPNQRVGIFYSASAGDGQDYALDFMAIFKAIGWDVAGPEAAGNFAGDSAGLAFVVDEGRRLPACAEALRDALRIYEIEVAAEGFDLWIGAGSSD
jgi:hypothetical protein